MEIILDVREADLIGRFEAKQAYPYSTQALDLGDVAFFRPSDKSSERSRDAVQQQEKHPCVLFERKTIRDLLSSISDGRYKEQSHRLLHASQVPPHNIIYIIEGLLSSVSPNDQKLVFSCMTSLSLFEGFSVFRTSTVQETADLLIHMATKLSRDMFVKKPFRHLAHQLPQTLFVSKKRSSNDDNNINNNEDNKDTHKDNNDDDDDGGLQEQETKTEGGGGEGETNENNNNISSYSSFVKKVKKENITDENIGVIMLTQIPGVSAPVADEIFKERTSSELIQWCKTDPEHALTDIKVKTATNRSMKLKCNVRQAIIHYLQKL